MEKVVAGPAADFDDLIAAGRNGGQEMLAHECAVKHRLERPVKRRDVERFAVEDVTVARQQCIFVSRNAPLARQKHARQRGFRRRTNTVLVIHLPGTRFQISST
jgi:hypothetical protein